MRANAPFGIVVAACALLGIGPAAGTLAVTSDPPGAAVYVDGTLVGRTPLNVPNLDAGEHRVRLLKDGYIENGRIVTIAAGATERLQVRLTAQQGSGISSGPPPNRKKWVYLGAAGAGAATAAIVLATRNRAPTVTAVSASPPNGLVFASTITFNVNATDPDGDSLTYSWDLGEGATSTVPAPSHVYATTGTFSPRVTVSDGKHSVTSSGAVMIKSMTGTWTGLIQGLPGTATVTGTFVLTQSGTSLSGTYSDAFGPGTLSGAVQTTAPLVRITISQVGFTPFVFTGTPGGDADSVSGVLNQSGFNNTPITIRRQ
jgi:hypothetical protein